MFNCKLTVLQGVWSHLINYRGYITSKEIGNWQWIVGYLTTLSEYIISDEFEKN
jgi:hypothetical protein